jgi:hypothetical protein
MTKIDELAVCYLNKYTIKSNDSMDSMQAIYN